METLEAMAAAPGLNHREYEERAELEQNEYGEVEQHGGDYERVGGGVTQTSPMAASAASM